MGRPSDRVVNLAADHCIGQPPSGASASWLGDEEAESWLTQCLEAAEAHPEPHAAIQATGFLALIAMDRMDHDAASELMDSARRTIDGYGLDEFGQMAIAHLALGRLALEAGDLDSATESFERGHELAERIRARPLVLVALLGQADVAHMGGERRLAATLFQDASNTLDELPVLGTLIERVAVVERRLRQARRTPTRNDLRPRPELVEELTDRELAVLRLLPGRLTQREIGEALHLSVNTVKTHSRNIFRKLAVNSRDEAVDVARSIGLP